MYEMCEERNPVDMFSFDVSCICFVFIFVFVFVFLFVFVLTYLCDPSDGEGHPVDGVHSRGVNCQGH